MAAPTFDARDVEQHKMTGGIGYFFWFVPLLACPDSQFGRYCAKQGIWFWIALLAIQVVFMVIGWVFGWVPILGSLLNLVGIISRFAVLALMTYYTIMAMAKGEAREAPIVGSIQLFK